MVNFNFDRLCNRFDSVIHMHGRCGASSQVFGPGILYASMPYLTYIGISLLNGLFFIFIYFILFYLNFIMYLLLSLLLFLVLISLFCF